jgi:two-component system OmpR family response regulator/two-component system copper resistance phosphate regulon response regulator CusR
LDLLVIEDDPLIGKTLRQGLCEAGHSCQWSKDGERGLELATTQQFDAIILDLMLPSRPGLEVLKELRGLGIQTPVIALTALGSLEDRVGGLKSGADDYIVKPFALVELMARLEAVCRRTAARPPAVMQVGQLTLDLPTRRVTREGNEVELTPTEFSLLELLMRYAGQTVTRRMLCEHLWESDWEGPTNVLEVHINRLRSKLDKGYDESVIQTVRGRGYALRAT